jgi:hypothetical protein
MRRAQADTPAMFTPWKIWRLARDRYALELHEGFDAARLRVGDGTTQRRRTRA